MRLLLRLLLHHVLVRVRRLMSRQRVLVRQMLMEQRLMLMRVARLGRQQVPVLLMVLRRRLRGAGLAVLRHGLLYPTVHHRMRRLARVIITAGIAVAVAAAEVREGGSVRAIRTGVVVGGVAGIVARLKAVEAGVAVVRALIQDRRDRRDAGPGATLAVLLAGYLYDHRGLARATGGRKIAISYRELRDRDRIYDT